MSVPSYKPYVSHQGANGESPNQLKGGRDMGASIFTLIQKIDRFLVPYVSILLYGGVDFHPPTYD